MLNKQIQRSAERGDKLSSKGNQAIQLYHEGMRRTVPSMSAVVKGKENLPRPYERLFFLVCFSATATRQQNVPEPTIELRET